MELIYYVWLCESGGDKELQALEGEANKCGKAWVIDHIFGNGRTLSHDILTDKKFENVGCAYTADPNPISGLEPITGVWVCELN